MSIEVIEYIHGIACDLPNESRLDQAMRYTIDSVTMSMIVHDTVTESSNDHLVYALCEVRKTPFDIDPPADGQRQKLVWSGDDHPLFKIAKSDLEDPECREATRQMIICYLTRAIIDETRHGSEAIGTAYANLIALKQSPKKRLIKIIKKYMDLQKESSKDRLDRLFN
jgi:hypothetical protein